MANVPMDFTLAFFSTIEMSFTWTIITCCHNIHIYLIKSKQGIIDFVKTTLQQIIAVHKLLTMVHGW